MYFRGAENRWVVDEYVDKIAPAWAYTKLEDHRKGWMKMADWVVNKHLRIEHLKHSLGFGGEAMKVTGVDEHLTGSDEEYCVALNGVYLRQYIVAPVGSVKGQYT